MYIQNDIQICGIFLWICNQIESVHNMGRVWMSPHLFQLNESIFKKIFKCEQYVCKIISIYDMWEECECLHTSILVEWMYIQNCIQI